MGNNGSNGAGSNSAQSKAYRVENFVNDSTAFRVFVKKRNKFIPGWLKINEDEIVFIRSGSAPQFWPIAFLRRYGYTCAGIFFFESGRRCASGEGLHTFQSHQAERIFQVVQSRIRSEELRASRASSVTSSRLNSTNNATKIHPVQRFSSEGPGNNFLLSRNPSNHSVTVRRPVPIASNGVLHSNSTAAINLVRDRDRPRSVVSAMEYDVAGVGRLMKAPTPNLMNASYTSQVDSCWSSQQQLDGEIINEHILNGQLPQNSQIQQSQRIPQPYHPIPIRSQVLNQMANGLSNQRKYHSYVNIDFPPNNPPPIESMPRLSYRELSAASDLNLVTNNGLYTSRIMNGAPNNHNLMTQSMIAVPSPKPTTAFEPQGDFPPIDRGRQTSTNAAPANRVYAQCQSAIDYSQVPLASTRQPMPPPSASASLPKSKIRLVSASQRSDCSSIASAAPSTSSAPAHSRVNYALIDFNKTRALEQFANVKQRAAEKLRQNGFIKRN